jgi:hypothetical protein
MRLITNVGIALIMLAALAFAPVAQALTVDAGTGEITNWGFTPFQNGPYGNWTNTGAAGAEAGETSNMAWAEGNNVVGPPAYDFPGGTTPYTPTPEGNWGEIFDTEFLAWRLVNETTIQVIGITSIDPVNGSTIVVNGESYTYHLGDVFINTDGNDATGYNGYDAALTAGSWSTDLTDPLHPGDAPYDHTMATGLYEITGVDDIHGITTVDAWGNNVTIAGLSNPFAVREGATQIGDVNLQTEIVDYEALGIDTSTRNESTTYILEWTFDIADLPGLLEDPDSQTNFDLSQLTFHWSVECGNDFINVGPRQEEPVIPEPATVALIGLGLATMGVARRRRR